MQQHLSRVASGQISASELVPFVVTPIALKVSFRRLLANMAITPRWRDGEVPIDIASAKVVSPGRRLTALVAPGNCWSGTPTDRCSLRVKIFPEA